MAEPARRLFFALWPPPEAAARLYDAAVAAQRSCGGRAMRRETLHLTLAFLGAVPAGRVDAAHAAAAGVVAEPFLLALDRLGCWKHNRIVWAGCRQTPHALAQLVAALGQGLRDAGFALEARPFAAHATLVRGAHCEAGLPALETPIAWTADEFVLIESRPRRDGPHYESIGCWPLAMH